MLDRDLCDLVRAGASVHLLRQRSKAPVEDDWPNAPRRSVKWLENRIRKHNLGIRLGEPSQIHGLYLHAIDMDIRRIEASDEAWRKLRSLFPGMKFERFPMVQSGSGGKACHIYFLTDRPFRSKKVAKSNEFDIVIEERDGRDREVKKHHWEIEVFGTGKQVAAPPSIHPTGGKYKWVRPFDIEGMNLGIYPTIDPDLVESVVGRHSRGVEEREVDPVDEVDLEIAGKIIEALVHLADDRETWRDVGMALKHQFGEDGWELFEEWSKLGKNYNKRENRTQWRSFNQHHENPITFRSLMKWAREAGYDHRAMSLEEIKELFEDEDNEDLDDEPAKREPSLADQFDDLPPVENLHDDVAKQISSIPPKLLRVPGVLGQVVSYYNATAIKPQPQFAVQTALAIGSIALGRNWCTESAQPNFTSLYLINILTSSSGKEHTNTVIDQFLEAAGLDALIGGGDYTSDSAIETRLEDWPKTISVIDEFAHFLRAVKSQNGGVKTTVEQVLLKLFSSVHKKNYRPKSFSGANKNIEQRKAATSRRIARPALTIVGMATPENFIDSLSEADVNNGLINRLLIVESPIALQYRQSPKRRSIPRAVVKWLRKVADECGEDDMAILLNDSAGDPSIVPEPKRVPFDQEALDRIDELDTENVDEQRQLKKYGLHALKGRTLEIAQRISLIVAASCGSDVIRRRHLDWAYEYVNFYHDRTVERFRGQLGKGRNGKIADQLYNVIASAGSEGIPRSVMLRRCAAFDNLETARERDEILNRLYSDYGVVHVNENPKKGGRPKDRYYALKSK